MNRRYILLLSSIAIITLCFFAANHSHGLNAYETSALTCAIFACSISTLSLALFTLRSISLLYVTRASVVVLAIVAILNRPPGLALTALVATIVLHLVFFSETLLSRCTRNIGSAGEDMFILRTPRSIALWFFFTWGVVWSTFVECIHLFGTNRTILGIIAVVFGVLITILFLPSQLRALLRRCVIVPHGIVASDPITLTDVVLLPLSKIASIELAQISSKDEVPESTFAAITSPKNIVAINLNDFTDSLIVRTQVNETERHNVNQLLFSVVDAKNFVALFYSRFHKVEPTELSSSQEKMVEKELGIETAPRSDAKLPQHRPKKKKTEK